MKFAKTKDASGKSVNDKTTVIYNERITIKNIPLAAYEYVVNGKPALEWVMERQAVTTDKDSGIVNDANLWATETMGNARYPLVLFLRVITVSLETMRIVNALPPLGDPVDLRELLLRRRSTWTYFWSLGSVTQPFGCEVNCLV